MNKKPEELKSASNAKALKYFTTIHNMRALSHKILPSFSRITNAEDSRTEQPIILNNFQMGLKVIEQLYHVM